MQAKEKAYKGMGMNGWVARWYARTRSNDMADFVQQAGAVAQRLTRGSVLEVAPGPGFFAIELTKLGDYQVTGLDISPTFVQIATANARKAGVNVEFREGNASAMPFADESFDFVYCSAAFKNFAEPVKALDEMHRVLRPGGESLIVDLRKDVSMNEIADYVRQSGRSRFDGWITKWAFRHMLIRRAYTRDQFSRMGEQSRFGRCELVGGPIGFKARFAKPVSVAVGAW
ncbi:MAG TPA: class I SAM-dependent methyltransferase [Tepidisphaeraceae bacterium]|jgi:ubiquinone/menaquinone biosynthesis C-methylase UbiE